MINDPDALTFAHSEWHEALHGLYELIDAPWMNEPRRDERASRKALQLQVASRLGLRVPDTLMTSDPDDVRRFIERHGMGNVIYKIFTATHQVWRETRLFRPVDVAELDALRLAPVIVQEYVRAVADVRVTVVGQRMFPMAIYTRGTSYEVDFRVSIREARTEPIELPPAVKIRLHDLMARFGLAYGAIDLRLTDDGDWVFLEINPAGEFLFCETGAGFPITEAVAGWLADPVTGGGPGCQPTGPVADRDPPIAGDVAVDAHGQLRARRHRARVDVEVGDGHRRPASGRRDVAGADEDGRRVGTGDVAQLCVHGTSGGRVPAGRAGRLDTDMNPHKTRLTPQWLAATARPGGRRGGDAGVLAVAASRRNPKQWHPAVLGTTGLRGAAAGRRTTLEHQRASAATSARSRRVRAVVRSTV
jgi:hypothetical protein